MLVQRARAAVQRDDPGIEAKPFLLGSGFGSLPDPQRYPDLVKVFIDTSTTTSKTAYLLRRSRTDQSRRSRSWR